MKTLFLSLILFGCTAIQATASSDCDPGPESGGGIDRIYDDGYVRVDFGGNLGGLTWNWGYDSPDQVQGDMIFFTCLTDMEGGAQQLLTDAFSLGGITAPSAPYFGSFAGPGPLISDNPLFRSITVVPEPTSVLLMAVGAVALLLNLLRSRRRGL